MSTFFGLHKHLRQVQILRSMVPPLPDSLRRIVKLGIRMSTTETNRRAVETSKCIEFLRPLQTSQAEELVQLVGRKFPEWNTLYDTSTARAVC